EAVVEKNLDFLVSFSAGVFLIFAYKLSGETIEHTSSVAEGLLWIFGGAVGIWLIFKLLPALHHHGPEHGSHEHLDPRRMLMSDAIHNVGDGIFLAASFAVAPMFGVWAGLSIFVHELLQEMSEFFVLRDGGYSVRKALGMNFLVSGTILVGAVGGYFLLDAFQELEGPLLGIAAGGILVVVLHDLIPHSVRESLISLHYIKHFAAFLLGVALMLLVNTIVPNA
ncbi:MAG: ZIP family metal transporter, partial [Patescibacteria group bacterium]